MFVNRFDLVISGRSLSDLLLAILASHSGLKVLVLERSALGGRSTFSNYIFTGLSTEGPLGRMFSELGVLNENFLKVRRKLHIPVQVVIPGHRINIEESSEKLANEIEREFPASKNLLLDLYENSVSVLNSRLNTFFEMNRVDFRLPVDIVDHRFYNKLMGMKTLEEFLRSYNEKPQIYYFLKAQATLFSRAVSEEVSFLEVLRALSARKYGVFRMKDSMMNLAGFLKEMLSGLGGQTKENVELERLVFDKGKICGGVLSSYEGVLFFNNVVDSKHFYGQKGRPSPYRKGYLRLPLKINLKEDILPVAMNEYSVFVSSYDRTMDEDNFLEIVTERSQGKASILVFVRIPLYGRKMTAEHLSRLFRKTLGHLCKLVPFLSESIESVFPLVGTECSCFTIDQCKRFWGGNLLQEYLSRETVYSSYVALREHMTEKVPVSSSGHPVFFNLFEAGDLSYPALGLDGEVIRAYEVFSNVARLAEGRLPVGEMIRSSV